MVMKTKKRSIQVKMMQMNVERELTYESEGEITEIFTETYMRFIRIYTD